MGNNQRTDLELIDSIRQNDTGSCDELIERYYKRVHSLAMKYMGCPNDASDVAQDVFCKIIGERKVCNFRGQSQFWSWLYRVTVNVCKVYFMKRTRLKETYYSEGIFPEDLEKALVLNDVSPDEFLIKKESVQHLTASLEQLPVKYRDVIKKRYFEDKSYIETAYALNITSDTLGVQLMRGKEMLAKIYRRLWISAEHGNTGVIKRIAN